MMLLFSAGSLYLATDPETLENGKLLWLTAFLCDTGSGPMLVRKGLRDLAAYRLPGQTNVLALVFDPLTDQVRCL